ncbi:hypothetical protein [Bacillus sp. MRMR6]|uniref:hypothetical protein n=1 Tax=Bacillus sp. MRMR6 TaxID=1928617 RepID=UPI00095352C7|nr:hypothetical protein [Bacillus sp. MRMR6]OLS39208.1 hypothetical protein BTR25_12390 [Bacillus sp. MRMR6]
MNKVEKVKVFSELFELVNYYYENRDQPVHAGFNFSEKVEECCELLGLDVKEFLKEFKINKELS